MIYVEAFALSALVWVAAFWALRDLNVFAPVVAFAAVAVWSYARLSDSLVAEADVLALLALGVVTGVVANALIYHVWFEPRPLAKSQATYRSVVGSQVAAGAVAVVSGAVLGVLLR